MAIPLRDAPDDVWLVQAGTLYWFTEQPGQWLQRKDARCTRYVKESSDGDMGRTAGGCGTGAAAGAGGSGSGVAAAVVGTLHNLPVDEHRSVKDAHEDDFVRIVGET